jgi:hypothetical protein
VPKLIAQSTAKGITQAGLQDWTPEKSIDQMDKGGVATAILSVSDPGGWFGDNVAARSLARECNDFAAKVIIIRVAPACSLPCRSLMLMAPCAKSNTPLIPSRRMARVYSRAGKYLGNPAFNPLMDELNRRKAVVFCHPFCPVCGTQTPLADGQSRGVEFVFDTTRTIVSLLSNSTVTQCPDIRFIWSHGGGTVPYITTHMTGAAQKLPKGLIYELQRFYYDTAQAFSPYTMPPLRSWFQHRISCSGPISRWAAARRRLLRRA